MTAPETYTYESLEKVQKAAQLEPSTEKQLKQFNCAKCLAFVVKMLERARLNEFEGRIDQAFIFYSRSATVCDVMLKKPDFKSFSSSPDARKFHDMFETALKRLEKTNDMVKAHFNELKVPTPPAPLAAIENRDESAAREKTGPLVRPKEIHDIVEKEHKQVLIIDFRSDQGTVFCHKNPLLIVVAVDPTILTPGCIMSTLIQSVEVGKRAKLWQLEQYESVVLVGDEIHSSFGEYKKNSPTMILVGALTSYNTTSKPKRHPLLLEKGFVNWKFTFPMFSSTTRPEAQKFLDPNSDFSILVAKMKEECVVNAEYPDLLAKPQPAPRQSVRPPPVLPEEPLPDLISQPTGERVVSEAPSQVSQAEQHAAESAATVSPISDLPSLDDTTGDHSGAPIEGQEKSVPEKRLPAVDRSTKPSYNQVPQSPPTQDTVPMEPAQNGTSRKLSDSSVDTKEIGWSDQVVRRNVHDALPAVPTLGGARKDPSAQNGDVSVQPAPARPPVIDRSTKRTLTPSQEQGLMGLYKLALEDIIRSGRRGRTRPGYTGLYNMGNTCFMNTSLQALFHTPGLRKVFSKEHFLKHVNVLNNFGTNGMVSACFSALMDCVWSGEFSAIRPRQFLNAFAERVNPELGDGRQHDAQEFLLYLLDALNEDTGKGTHKGFEQNYSGTNLVKDALDYEARTARFLSSPVKDEFYVRTVSELRCSECGTTSVTFEEMSQISLELPSRVTYSSLDDCLTTHFAQVTLDGSSCWNCPTCKQARRATRSTKIWKLPPVLVVHMKRFSHTGSGFVKNEMEVDFRVSHMAMDRHLHQAAPNQLSSYHLYAVTNHFGTLNSGHYISCVRNIESNEWTKFDDETASVISSSSLVSRNAFILYYRR